MDIEALKTEARKLAREMTINAQDVDDSLAVLRTRLRSVITKLVPNAERLGAKGQDDAAEQINAMIEDIYADAATAFECEEEITSKVVLREIVVATDLIKTKTGYAIGHHAIRKYATEFHERQDLRSVRELLRWMPELRKQVADLRKNYGVIEVGTDKVMRWLDGWAEVLSLLDYVDFCTEFLEREKTRLENVPMAA